jgi:hypothetical protein
MILKKICKKLKSTLDDPNTQMMPSDIPMGISTKHLQNAVASDKNS